MVLHVEPISDVEAVAVDGDGLTLGHAGDDQGDELLRVLSRSVVVGAVGGDGVQPVGVVVSADQVVAASLAGAVGAVRRVGHLLVELTLVAQGAVDLVRADMKEAAVPLPRPGLPRGLQHGEGAHHVGLDEGGGTRDAAVHVALGRQVEDPGDVVLFDQVACEFQVLDVAHHQLDAVEALDLLGIRRIGEFVQHHDAVARMVAMPAVDQVAANEARAAGDEDGFRHGGSPGEEKTDSTRRRKGAKKSKGKEGK